MANEEKQMYSTDIIYHHCTKFAWFAHNNYEPSNRKVWYAGNAEEFKNTCMYFDSDNSFAEFYDFKTGYTFTTNVLSFIDDTINDTGKDPETRNFPELLDVGIMGHCSTCKTCMVGCYQKAADHKERKNMSFETYKKIIDEVKDRTYQIALGGAGNPNNHEDFTKIVDYTVSNGMNVSFTTAMISDEDAKLCKEHGVSAVAVSYHPASLGNGYDWLDTQEYTRKSIENLQRYSIKTNIHYVLSKDSIAAATMKLENGGFGDGINAVIFLRYKPVGFGNIDKCLDADAPETKAFFKAVESFKGSHKIGFDSCCVPLIKKHTSITDTCLISCEGARRSMYVGPDGANMVCSFGNQNSENFVYGTIEEAWKSDKFCNFRKCSQCPWVK